MAKILFENKEDVYVDSSIPDKNKVKADDMNNIKEAVNTNENKILLAISDTAPSECATGDLYYNTTSKKIFEATGTNTWGTTGTNPTSNTIYILFDTKTTYSYDGTDLVSVGGGGAEVSVSTTEPTGDEDDSVKLWINPNEAPSGSLNPISNTYGVAQDKGYSQEYINKLHTYSTDEIRVGTWIDNKPIYRKTIVYDSNTPLANGQTDIPHNVSNIGEYRKIVDRSFIYNGDTFGGYQNSTFNADVSSINATNIVVSINGWGNLFNKAFFTIEYTKTTD
jgi:hypothetical protein